MAGVYTGSKCILVPIDMCEMPAREKWQEIIYAVHELSRMKIAPDYVSQSTGKLGNFGNAGFTYIDGDGLIEKILAVTPSGEPMADLRNENDLVYVRRFYIRKGKMFVEAYSPKEGREPTSEVPLYYSGLMSGSFDMDFDAIVHGHDKLIIDAREQIEKTSAARIPQPTSGRKNSQGP